MATFPHEFADAWWLRHHRSPRRVARWLLLWLPMGLAILLATPFAVVARLLGIRFLGINHRRIGHLAVEPDCFVKARALGHYRGIVPFACAPTGETCNAALLDCWRPHIRWITRSSLCYLLRPLAWHPLLALGLDAAAPDPDGGCRYIAAARRWNGRAPVIALSARIERDGAAALRQLGLPPDAWFVCVHNREGGYIAHEEDWHAYRNCRIESYLPAMQAVAAAGGWCIRIGDPSLTPLPPTHNAIDYAHHHLRADWLDLYLMAHCRFFLGNSSGPFLVACIFGRPVALANMTPAGAVLPYGQRDLGIPKLLRRKGGAADHLGFAEMFRHPSSRYHYAAQFARDAIEVVDNTSDEILALTEEMLCNIAGMAHYGGEDAGLQSRFRQLLQPNQMSYGAESRIGRDFLRRHRHLLP